MLFNSFSFLIFFPVVTVLYFFLPHKYRWALLLLASSLFYMAFVPYYILILFVVISIDYYAGIKIEGSLGPDKKRIYLILSILSTCLVLFIFKYFNFFEVNIHALAEFLHWNYNPSILNIVLPIGLSFHTFQSLSYVIEVYRGKQKAERNFGIYSLYVMFFPQLVAGPIERPQNLLHQFYEEHGFEYERITYGLQRMLWGFFKKVVIADNLAFYVDKVYDLPHEYSGLTLIMATIFFAFQIYCDFSGYSDIAIGSAKVMGFNLMENFKNPYLSSSVQEFWSRWHISLSSWFRDYLYIPLGGKRVGAVRWCFSVIIVFLVSGLWHGANWTYVVWGLIHGVYLVSYRLIKRFFDGSIKISRYLVYLPKRLITFFFILIAWVFFRSKTLPEAYYILTSSFFGFLDFIKAITSPVFTANISPLKEILQKLADPLPSLLYLACFLGIVLVLMVTEILDYRFGLINFFRSQKSAVRWSVYVIIILGIMNLGVVKEIPFIYYQF